MITIVDYGMGNLASVKNAVKRYTAKVSVSSEPQDIEKADKLILPGVGAFEDAYNEIEKRNLLSGISAFLESGRPFLGICLGLQLLFTRSFENGEHKGFDAIKGDVVGFDRTGSLKIPHMGWNNIVPVRPGCPLLKGVAKEAHVYFVHSYYVVPEDGSVVAATTDYGVNFCSMLWKENIFAMQFHPEKSQEQGLKIIENFVGL